MCNNFSIFCFHPICFFYCYSSLETFVFVFRATKYPYFETAAIFLCVKFGGICSRLCVTMMINANALPLQRNWMEVRENRVSSLPIHVEFDLIWLAHLCLCVCVGACVCCACQDECFFVGLTHIIPFVVKKSFDFYFLFFFRWIYESNWSSGKCEKTISIAEKNNAEYYIRNAIHHFGYRIRMSELHRTRFMCFVIHHVVWLMNYHPQLLSMRTIFTGCACNVHLIWLYCNIWIMFFFCVAFFQFFPKIYF